MLIVIGMMVSAIFGLSIGVVICESVDKTENVNTKEFKYLADQVYSCKNRLENMEMTNTLTNDKIICLLKDFKEATDGGIRTI